MLELSIPDLGPLCAEVKPKPIESRIGPIYDSLPQQTYTDIVEVSESQRFSLQRESERRPNNFVQQLERIDNVLWQIRLHLTNPKTSFCQRPPRNFRMSEDRRKPWNGIYDTWFESLTPDEQCAELELRRKGWYNYEGDDAMIVQDKDGKDLHTEDVVTWQEQDCVIVCILAENEIQLNPLGEGLPELVHPNQTSLKFSFIEKLRNLRTNEELLAIIHAAERRLEASKVTGTKSPGPRTTKVAPKAKGFEVEL